jgi:tRNA threonylcarbamoyladenosine biosynthesis protein TsaB
VSALIVFDTATPATVAGLRLDSGEVAELRDDPPPAGRPRHAQRLLSMCAQLLAGAGLGWRDVGRIGVGVGPGTFTGLRIGVATGRALAQATGAELIGVSTLAALAAGARAATPGQAVLAVLDARRGEAFAASWDSAGEPLSPPAAVAPEALTGLADQAHAPWLAAGDGAIRFRDRLEPALVSVPEDGSRVHLVDAAALCELAAAGDPVDRERLVPDYLRRPDAEISHRNR